MSILSGRCGICPLLNLLIFGFLLPGMPLNGQNFVVNGGFERLQEQTAKKRRIEPCSFASASAYVNKDLEAWQTFFSQTPDVIEMDSAYAGCVDFPAPYRGRRMAGLILYHPFYDNQFNNDYHEFLQGTLAKPLEPGKLYRVSVWMHFSRDLATRHLRAIYGSSAVVLPMPCGNLGFYFSENNINPNEEFMRSQEMFPVEPQLNFKNIFDTPEGWRKLQFTFRADKPYKYFVFGNFYSDAVTPLPMSNEEREAYDQQNVVFKKTKGPRKPRVSYYLVDNFAVLEVPVDDPATQFYTQKGVTLEAEVLFGVGSADLNPDAYAQLEPLRALLLDDSGLRVEVGGHSDATGDPVSNQALSAARAQAVCRWLQQQGVQESQLSSKGYGDTRPVADNASEQGRAQNRRVEVRMVE